jgi:hypothetical protein
MGRFLGKIPFETSGKAILFGLPSAVLLFVLWCKLWRVAGLSEDRTQRTVGVLINNVQRFLAQEQMFVLSILFNQDGSICLDSATAQDEGYPDVLQILIRRMRRQN